MGEGSRTDDRFGIRSTAEHELQPGDPDPVKVSRGIESGPLPLTVAPFEGVSTVVVGKIESKTTSAEPSNAS